MVEEQPGTKQVKANMMLKTFANSNPAILDKEVNEFLLTVDNTKRYINSRNAYAVGDKYCIQIWYLEAIEEEPKSEIVVPFGNKDVKQPGNDQKAIG
jgi:hypothetical protein